MAATKVPDTDYYKDGLKYYKEYKLINKKQSEGGDQGKGLMAIAREQMGKDKQSRYTEILKLNNNGEGEKISPPYAIDINWTLLVPAAAPPPPSDSFTLSETMNVRTSSDTTDDKNKIYEAGSKTKFTYDKSSLVTDKVGRVWAEVTLIPPNNKDNAGKVLTKGWICVKEGSSYYTVEQIDMPKPKTAKG